MEFTTGVCRICGCTDARACPGGCGWSNEAHTLCTRCDDQDELDRLSDVEDDLGVTVPLLISPSDGIILANALKRLARNPSAQVRRSMDRRRMLVAVTPLVARIYMALEAACPATAEMIGRCWDWQGAKDAREWILAREEDCRGR